MKFIKVLIVLIMLLSIFAALIPAISAERDSLKVIITAEDRIYHPGDTIFIEVMVYDKGVLTTPDEIFVKVETHRHDPDEEVIMSEISTGVFQGSYEILDDDHHAYFDVYVEKGTDTDGAELNIQIVTAQLELYMHFAHQSNACAWPGDSLTATITSRYRGDAVDIDDFAFLRLEHPDDEVTDLNSTWISIGTYWVTFTIPEVNESGYYELQAHATYAGAHAEAHSYIAVNVLRVWYRFETLAGSTATFTLGVADENGKGVPNAEVTFFSPQEISGTTNEEGTAIFSLTNVWNGIHVNGNVAANGLNQSFYGNIYTSGWQETPNPSHNSFDVIYQGEEYIYKSGSSITRSYTAYNSSVPMQNMELYYYIISEGMDMELYEGHLIPDEGSHIDGALEVIKTGNVTTDQLGGFSISFKAPSHQGYVYIYFESGIPRHPQNYNPHSRTTYDYDDELVYEEDFDYVFISKGELWSAESIEIETDPLVVGGKTKITVKTSKALGDGDEIFAKWMPGIPTSGLYIDEFESQWVSWVDGGNCIFLERKNDKEYRGETVIPDFMSDDGEYSIITGYIDGDTGYPNVNNIALKEGESAGEKDLDMIVMALLLGAVAFVLIGLGLGAFVMDKKTGIGPGVQSGEGLSSQDVQSPPSEQISPPSEMQPPMEASDQPPQFNSSLLENQSNPDQSYELQNNPPPPPPD
ncbi:MAG: Ig-like domain-containing protein [Thermoplasmata archaeon]|nr:MAG: Ig-like domain-containing protein [Thermoplasmata archaeon]